MDELSEKLLKFIDINKKLGRQPYYIVDFNGLPILLRKDDLMSGISRTYATTRDNKYLDMPDELLSKEIERAKNKIVKEKL